MLPLIQGNRLQSHIDGTTVIPPVMVVRENELVPNSAFEEWFSIDKLLIGWLRNTITQDVGAKLLHCRTTHELCVGARALSCASTKSHVMVFKVEFHQTRKNTMKMEEYLAKMKNISYQLTLARAPIPIEDLVLHTLNGFDSEYNPIVVTLMDQSDPTWIDVQSSLLSFESRLEQLNHFIFVFTAEC